MGKGDHRRIIVGNLNYQVTEAQLKELFSEFGEIEELRIPFDSKRSKSKGLGIIDFRADESADKAFQRYHRQEIFERICFIQFGDDKRQSPNNSRRFSSRRSSRDRKDRSRYSDRDRDRRRPRYSDYYSDDDYSYRRSRYSRRPSRRRVSDSYSEDSDYNYSPPRRRRSSEQKGSYRRDRFRDRSPPRNSHSSDYSSGQYSD